MKPISPESYSSWHKLLKITSIVLRFINNCRKSPLDRKFGFVTADETTDSLKLSLKVAQMEYFREELDYLKRNATGNGPPLVNQLRLFLDDDDVMRCRGRLENANVTRDTVYPILLPKKSVYTKLIIIAAHRRIMHGKTRATLACVREKFWTPNGIQVVKSIIRNCVTCIKAHAIKFLIQKSRNFTFFKFESFHIILNQNLMGISFLKTVFINNT